MPTTAFGTVQTGLSYTTSNIIAYLRTGNTYLLGGNTFYDVAPLQGSVYKGAYVPSAFSPTYLSLISGQPYAVSPYGVAALGSANRQVASFSGGNIVASSVPVNTVSGGYNTASFWMQWPGNQVNLVPFSFNSYSIYVTGNAIGFSSLNGNVLGAVDYGMSGFTTTPWVHVVAEFKNGAPAVGSDILYINGVRQNLFILSGSFPSAAGAGSTISIGGYTSGSTYNSFNGVIANLQVYNALLTPYQAYSLYTSGINSAPTNYSNLIGWWPLNGNLNDYSRYHDNGTISGKVSYAGLSGYAGSVLNGGAFYSTIVGGVQGISQCYGISSCSWNGPGKIYVPIPQSYVTSSAQVSSTALGFVNNTIPGSVYFNPAQNDQFIANAIPLNSTSGGINTVSLWMDWVPNGNTAAPSVFQGQPWAGGI